MIDYQKLMTKNTQEEKNALMALKLPETELLNAAATAIACLKLMDTEYNDLLAKYLNLQKYHVDNSSLLQGHKDEINAYIIAQLRADVTKIRTDRSKEIASKGGEGKVLADKDGKQKAKAFVKECWDAWQLDPKKYKNKAAFARDMLAKQEDVLVSQKVIESWCKTWQHKKLEPC